MPTAKRSSGRRTPREHTSDSGQRHHSLPWSFHRAQSLQILRLAPLRELPWLVHGFSTHHGGVSSLDGEKLLNLSFMEWDTRENVLENRRRFSSAADASDFTLMSLKQIHSDVIRHFPGPPLQPCVGDASITDRPTMLLAVQTADCVPLLLVDPKKRAIAALHAGWRGTLARLGQKTVGRMQMEFGSNPDNLLAALGPSIGPCCYEVGTELVTKFTSQFVDAHEYFDEPRSGEEPNPLQWLNMMPPGHQLPAKNVHLDLRKANRSQLLAAGLHAQNIFSCDLCTACRTDLFFSYRKEGPRSGRMLSVIGIR